MDIFASSFAESVALNVIWKPLIVKVQAYDMQTVFIRTTQKSEAAGYRNMFITRILFSAAWTAMNNHDDQFSEVYDSWKKDLLLVTTIRVIH